ncbi:MAG: pyruvate kinase [Crocinitomicaceae bacterium]|nr:pyruvate kinase [Crocinitomicaceae bacterium]
MMSEKFTKIVATVGPASTSYEVLECLITEGVNVIRLNFSHGDHATHATTVERVRAIDDKLGTHTALLADMQGPKLRVGMMEDGTELVKGSVLTIKVGEGMGNADVAWTRYDKFAEDVKPGEPVLLDDGKLRLRVQSTNGIDAVTCMVEHGGILNSRKGLNLPSTAISLPSLTEKDRADLDFALGLGVDWIGLSFVRSARDVVDLRERIQKAGSHARIVAKVEKPEAVEDLEVIVASTDAIMIARGDLGVEVPMEQVPMIQKRTIEMCQRKGKPVIVATQMMESMVDNIAPTRAEVTDVANAVLDGADAVMLSGETSVGNHPIEVIKAMRSIVTEIEKESRIYYTHREPDEIRPERQVTDAICYNACALAERVGAKAIVTMTFSGYTAYKVASQRPNATIHVFTGNKSILGQLALCWGVVAHHYDKMISTDHTISDVKTILQRESAVVDGDRVIHVASMPIAEAGMSNMLKVSQI